MTSNPLVMEVPARSMVLASTAAHSGFLPDPHSVADTARDWHRAMPYTRLTDYGMGSADARELLWRTATGEDWVTASREIGERQREVSRRLADQGRRESAAAAARSSFAAFNAAQAVIDTDTAVKLSAYESFHAGVEWYASLVPGIERTELPYGDGVVHGWQVMPVGSRAAATVVVWGGLSGWGASFLSMATALAARDVACILAEGPGQGRTRLVSGLRMGKEEDLDGYQVFVDYVLAHPRLGGRVGLHGNSFGGLIAARIAARDPRVDACVINGASARPVVPAGSGVAAQVRSFTGIDEEDGMSALLSSLALDPARDAIHAPCLVLRGGADAAVTGPEQTAFLPALAHPESQLLEWPDGQHTLYNHASERDSMAADWFRTHLVDHVRGTHP